jgi:Cft2 family RNA processing exonuclease
VESEESIKNTITENSAKVNLVGIKRMKSAHVWRIEFDVYEEDGEKVKTLVEQIDQDFHLFLVPIDKNPKNS